MRVAALDLGTNTFLLLIAERQSDGSMSTLFDCSEVIRLGQGVDRTGLLHADALARAETFLRGARTELDRYKVDRVAAVATSAARDAKNGQELIEIGMRHGIPIETITGAREAELSFWGSLPSAGHGELLLIDIGGGSTELMLGDSRGLSARESLDIGAVRLTERHLVTDPPTASELFSLHQAIQGELTRIRPRFHLPEGATGIAVAGTAVSLLAMDLGRKIESSDDGGQLTMAQLRRRVSELERLTLAERRQLPGLDPKRADVITAGATILLMCCQTFGLEHLAISTRGLRYGLARHLLESLI
jgi:exopolyphosphatase/guanosine-5'-triphosphate,3'-diphosphate pyrophosphatase